MRGQLLRLHRRLLPDRQWVGWVPYLWLVYLAVPIAGALRPERPRLQLVATVAAIGAFLLLYFHAYWTSGRSTLRVLAAIGAIGDTAGTAETPSAMAARR